jgi:hypothetical protein
MDVLLARQYNLISCMAEQGGMSGSKATSLEEKTLGMWLGGVQILRRERTLLFKHLHALGHVRDGDRLHWDC